MTISKRLLSLALACLLPLSLSCAYAQPAQEHTLPIIGNYRIIQNEHELVHVMIYFSDELADHCIISVGSGTVSLDALSQHSVSWDSEKREIRVARKAGRYFQLPLSYVPSVDPKEFDKGVEYVDELEISCYAADGSVLHAARLVISAGISKMMVELKTIPRQL